MNNRLPQLMWINKLSSFQYGHVNLARRPPNTLGNISLLTITNAMGSAPLWVTNNDPQWDTPQFEGIPPFTCASMFNDTGGHCMH